MFGFFKRKKHNGKLEFYSVDLGKYNKIISNLTKEEQKIYTEIVQGARPSETVEKLKMKKNIFDRILKSIFKKLNVDTHKDLICKYGNTFNYVNKVKLEE